MFHLSFLQREMVINRVQNGYLFAKLRRPSSQFEDYFGRSLQISIKILQETQHPESKNRFGIGSSTIKMLVFSFSFCIFFRRQPKNWETNKMNHPTNKGTQVCLACQVKMIWDSFPPLLVMVTLAKQNSKILVL